MEVADCLLYFVVVGTIILAALIEIKSENCIYEKLLSVLSM